MRQKIASIAQLLRLPSLCVLCNQYHQDTFAVCTACTNLLPLLGPACRHCAMPVGDPCHLVCGTCSNKKPLFDYAFAVWRFEEPLRTLLHAFKYRESLYLRDFLATRMLEVLPIEARPQCLLPIPMHPQRLKQRGFNQAVELAKFLARALHLPSSLWEGQKVVNTVPQVSLSGNQRRKNLHNVFKIKALPYEHITLVDDLLTTGSTANELAKILKKQGVARVDVWCCARVAE